MSRQETWNALVSRGCSCGAEDYSPCQIHTRPDDNRGIRAWLEAGMPQGFPSQVTCGVCSSSDALMYPSVDLENGDVDVHAGGYSHEKTCICPNCSTPYLEARLRAKCEANGYAGRLNDKRVFALGVAAA